MKYNMLGFKKNYIRIVIFVRVCIEHWNTKPDILLIMYIVIIDNVSYELGLRSLARTFVLHSQSLVFIALHLHRTFVKTIIIKYKNCTRYKLIRY